jgi:hypothetical protein
MSSRAWSNGVPSVRILLEDGRCIHDFVDEGYEPRADAFRANFVGRRDLGLPVPLSLGSSRRRSASRCSGILFAD